MVLSTGSFDLLLDAQQRTQGPEEVCECPQTHSKGRGGGVLALPVVKVGGGKATLAILILPCHLVVVPRAEGTGQIR